jgi:cysteine protease ATG4
MDLASIHVHVSQDSTIYIQDILDDCYTQENSSNVAPWQNYSSSASSSPINQNKKACQQSINTWKSLILLIPLRLGNERLNPIYADCLKAMLSLEYCVGIIGGRPKHSLYFVGFQEDKLIHLDPHYCQDMVDVNQENFPVSSFHCKAPKKTKISKMDPSCCIGFYLNKRSDFDRLQSSIQPVSINLSMFKNDE